MVGDTFCTTIAPRRLRPVPLVQAMPALTARTSGRRFRSCCFLRLVSRPLVWPARSIHTIGPALLQIGDLWHAGAVTVAQEHLASNVLGGTLVHLLRLAQPSDAERRVLLACFADEEHVLGLYGAGLRFASWGYRTLMLGASTPPVAVARAVDALSPDLVGLSATMLLPPPRARELVDAYADACHSTPWAVGGDAAESMRPWIEDRGGICIGRDLPGARQVIEKAVVTNRRKRNGRGE
ncbi:MAG: cobalamin B12-binding domain-containing protein [Polyangiaceae bacterium]|nr:cobalamin B12-binding domain-containing protein [Polyangiaceae bacterium]